MLSLWSSQWQLFGFCRKENKMLDFEIVFLVTLAIILVRKWAKQHGFRRMKMEEM